MILKNKFTPDSITIERPWRSGSSDEQSLDWEDEDEDDDDDFEEEEEAGNFEASSVELVIS